MESIKWGENAENKSFNSNIVKILTKTCLVYIIVQSVSFEETH